MGVVMKSTSEFDVKFGEKLEYNRVLKGFTRQQLAKQLNITQQQLQKYEKGVNRVSVSRAYDICRILNIELEWLIGSDLVVKSKNNKALTDIMQMANNLEDPAKLSSLKKLVKAFTLSFKS